MSIYSEINRLELAKENLKLKLESKGVTVPEDARINDYAALINLLPEIKESEFINRIVDNGNSGTGKAKIYNIKGKSIVWNQLVASPNGEINSDYAQKDCTLSYNAIDKESTIMVRSSPNNMWIRPKKDGHESDYDDFIVGHRYLFQVYAKSENAIGEIIFGQANYSLDPRNGYSISKNATTSYQYFMVITPAMTLSDAWGYVRLGSKNPASTTGNIIYKNLQITDLTFLYGTEIDDLTDAQIFTKYEAEFGTNYYGYNPGTLINNDAEAIESIGFNQWDEEWELGTLDANGQPISSNMNIRSKNFIPIFPSIYYYYNIPNTWIDVCFYDISKTYIGRYGTDAGALHISPANARYIKFRGSQSYGTTYNNDICINVSNPAKNGTYESYKKFTLPLNLNSFNVKDSEDNIITVNGLKSAGSVYDEIVGNKYIKRVGSVDLGSLSWVKTTSGNNIVFYANLLDGSKQASIQSICSKYCVIADASFSTDKAVYTYGSTLYDFSRVGIRDSAYDNATENELAVATNGVKLYYELTIPIEYDLVDEIDTIYDVDKNGVERIVSPVHVDGSPSAPFRASIGYPVDQEQ